MTAMGSKRANHDIRNALNVIMGSAQLLQEPDLSLKQQKSVERILTASRELLAMLEGQSSKGAHTSDLKLNISLTEGEPWNRGYDGGGRVLLVDDEPAFLESNRQLLHEEFEVQTAIGGEAGLAVLKSRGPFAVIVSDLQMPGMRGDEFLRRARETAPDTVRMVLTGHPDTKIVEALNRGHIFRILTKPCERDTLRSAIAQAVIRYRRVSAETEVLESSLVSTIEVLTGLLAAANPEAFERSVRITRYVRHLLAKYPLSPSWYLEAAAMLSQIGCIDMDGALLTAAYAGSKIAAEDQSRFEAHPLAGRDLLMHVPRLEAVAWMIGQQLAEKISRDVLQTAALSGEAIITATKMLRLAVAYDSLRTSGRSEAEAIGQLRSRSAEFGSEMIVALASQ